LKPRVIEFSDFREFLTAYARHEKASRKNWSLGIWTRQLGLKGTASLSMILQGKRNPGEKMTESLANYFKFTELERDYFFNLIKLAKTKNVALQAILQKRIDHTQRSSNVRVIDEVSFRMISNWYSCALREMTQLRGFRSSTSWIAKRFRIPVPAEAVLKAQGALLKLGLAAKSANGVIRSTGERVTSSHDVTSSALRELHRQGLTNSQFALESMAVDEREFSISFFNIDVKDLPRAKEFLRQMRAKFITEFEKQEGDETFQFAFQLFPVTGAAKHKSGS
jgi:uncharacterized protein (TIGR02147 family)